MFECSLNYCAKTGFEFRLLIRNRPALLHVDKVERHHVEATRGESICKHAHETTRLVRACSMAQEHSQAGAILFSGWIKKRSDCFFISDFDGELLGFVWHLRIGQTSFASIARASFSSLLNLLATPVCTLGELLEK